MPPPTTGLAAKLIAEAGKGYPLRLVARLARIRPHDLAAWVKEGDADDATPEAQRFTRDWHEAQCRFLAGQHDAVAESGATGRDEPNAGARLALLERLAPDEYARRAPSGEAPPAPSGVPAAVAALPPEARAELKAVMDKRRGAQQADVSLPSTKTM